METFQDKLKKIEDSGPYPFHMPGHKRVAINPELKNPYLRDITEIDGYDNLHCPEDFILEEEKFAAGLFGAEESFYLINGSSCGILAAIMTVAEGDGKLLIARNAHKSVFNGLYLTGKQADYIYPEFSENTYFAGSVPIEDIRERIQREAYAGILITSPTYEGVVSDIREICDAAHAKGIPVIVDEAHGAHLGIFGTDDYFPKSAVRCGADLVIQSTHKTLPAMTQTALLHVQGGLIDRQKLRYHLSVFQSSSPSYILMESISDSLHYCGGHREELLEQYKERLENFYKKTAGLKNLLVIAPDTKKDDFCFRRDPSKLVICIRQGICFTGKQLCELLREDYHLQLEMAEKDYAVAMTSIMDSDEGFERLLGALYEIDERLSSLKNEAAESNRKKPEPKIIKDTESILSVRQALNEKKEFVSIRDAAGRCCGEFLYLYPPDIPILIPGERITEEILLFLKEKKQAGFLIRGTEQFENDRIACVSKN